MTLREILFGKSPSWIPIRVYIQVYPFEQLECGSFIIIEVLFLIISVVSTLSITCICLISPRFFFLNGLGFFTWNYGDLNILVYTRLALVTRLHWKFWRIWTNKTLISVIIPRWIILIKIVAPNWLNVIMFRFTWKVIYWVKEKNPSILIDIKIFYILLLRQAIGYGCIGCWEIKLSRITLSMVLRPSRCSWMKLWWL